VLGVGGNLQPTVAIRPFHGKRRMASGNDLMQSVIVNDLIQRLVQRICHALLLIAKFSRDFFVFFYKEAATARRYRGASRRPLGNRRGRRGGV
jgi:hypothetical protein